MPNRRRNIQTFFLKKRSPASSLDTDYLLWKAAVGSVGATQETATNALIVSLKAHSLWTVHDRIWLFAAENATQALTCIKTRNVATAVSSPTFTASQGYAGNASTSYINTGFSPSNGVNLVQNSASVSIYVRTNRTTDANKLATGASDIGGFGSATRLGPYWTGGPVIVYPLNGTNPFEQFSSPAGTARGMWTSSRTGGTTTDIYRNSSSTSLNTSTVGSSGSFSSVTANFFVGAGNNIDAGGLEFPSDDQIAIAAYGAGLSNTNAAQFQTDINAYMTALGTNVY